MAKTKTILTPPVAPAANPLPLTPVNPTDYNRITPPTDISDYNSGLVHESVPPELPNTDEFAKDMAQPKVSIGQSGTLIYGGIITLEEYSQELTGQNGLDIFDEMRRSDATVAAAMKICKLPIIATDWRIEAASQDPQDVSIQQFVSQQLFGELNWKQTLKEFLLEFEFGFSLGELIYKTVEFEGNNYIGLDRIASRKQRSIFSWVTQYNQRGVTQILPSGGMVSIPREKLVLITHDREGDNYPGISLLRPAYKHWYLAKGIEAIDAVALERNGAGVLKLITPQGANEKDKSKARELMENVRANEESYLEMPNGFDSEFMDMKAGTLRDPSTSLAYHKREILKSVLAQFLDLGATKSSGSRAVSEDQSDLFIKALDAEADNIAESFNQDVIKRLVKINFPTVKVFPKLKYSPLGTPDIKGISEAVDLFVRNKAITTDFNDEQYFRELMRIPLKDEDEQAVDDFKQKLDLILQSIGSIALGLQPPVPAPGQPPIRPTENDPDDFNDELDDEVNDDESNMADDKTSNIPPVEKAPVNPVTDTTPIQVDPTKAMLQNELRQFIRETQILIAKRTSAGDPISKEEVQGMELQLLEKQAEIEDSAAKAMITATPAVTPTQAAEAKINEALSMAAEILGELNEPKKLKSKARSTKKAH